MLAAAFTLVCLVVGIQDGDTLTARCPTENATHPFEQVRVRLAGIDAPEKGQAYGQRAKQALSDLAYRKDARLECIKHDRYRRSVCNVYVASPARPNDVHTLDAGLAMVASGYAWWYRAYSREQTPAQRGQYERAEQAARSNRIGLWRDASPMPPWEFRHHPPAATPDDRGCFTGPKGGRYRIINGKKRYGC